MIISGRNPVIEAKKCGKAKKIIVRQGASIHFDNINVPFEVLGRRAFEEKYGTETQGVVCEVDAGGEGSFPELIPVFGPAELMLDTVVDVHTVVDEPFPDVGEIRVRGHGHNALVIEPVEKLAAVFLRILLAAYHPVGESLNVARELGPGAGRPGKELKQIPLEVPLCDNWPRLLLVVGGIARAFLRTHYLVKRHALDVDILVVI